jgi:uncharacterized 2Fe-2S/4Fe-4S cluster protein (DUF4445 family)
MPLITVIQKQVKRFLTIKKGELLLPFLRQNDVEIFSPCGGNGTCGKCKIFIKGHGSVTSCLYPVFNDIEIILPDTREAAILIDQHAFTIQLPFNPGLFSDLSSFPHGVAIDIGTTTVVFYFINLFPGGTITTKAVINPQTKYGGDVISRINYSASSPGGLETLRREIVSCINFHLDHFQRLMEISAQDLVKVVIAGNNTMLHILLGVNPLPIALAPFKPAFTAEQNRIGKELDLHCHPKAEIKILPSVSAYVGADIVAGLASIKPMKQYSTYLFMDIGTNGEMALVTPEKIWCCATAAGPAFEGANISCGMSAVEGAINTYNSDGYTVIGDYQPMGLCGSGLIDVVSHLIKKQIVNPDGLIETDFIIVPADKSSSQKEISITQQDIREVQLAKSAIRAGVNILMNKASLTFDDIDVLYLSGGFGNYIDKDNAIAIGMLPFELSNRIISLGNTSGTGALLSLKSIAYDEVIREVINKAEYIELSTEDDFTMDFVMHMGF